MVVLVGLCGVVLFKQTWLDVAMAIPLCLLLIRVCWQVLKTNLPWLVDQIAIAPESIHETAIGVPGVLNVHDIASRGVLGQRVFIELHMVVDADDLPKPTGSRSSSSTSNALWSGPLHDSPGTREYAESTITFRDPWLSSGSGSPPSTGPLDGSQCPPAAAEPLGWDRPIALLERCWLRLQIHPISKLSAVLPPDNSGDAPELIHFRNLIRTGFSSAEAEEQCWEDFGKTACSEALQRFWAAQDQGCNGWTLQAYLDLLSRYRSWIETAGPNPLPVLVLARQAAQNTTA